jgi:PAS domain S-box-containing protein
MVACSPVALYSINPQGIVSSWNASAERVFGWAADEVIGKPLPVVPEDKREEHERFRAQILEGTPLVGMEVIRCRKNGERFWGSLSAAPMHDSAGELLGIMGAMQDITERKLAENALRHSEEQFRSLVEGAPDAIFIQTNHCFAYANTACIRLLNASNAEALLGTPVFDRFHQDDRESILHRIRRLNEEKQPVELALERMVALDGEIIAAEVTAVPFDFEGHSGALVFIRDVRDRIAAERNLEESEQRFRHAVQEAPFPIMIHAEDGAALAVSSAWKSISGYNDEELATTQAWTRLAFGPRAGEVQTWLDATYGQAGPHSEGEFEITCKDKTRRFWDFRSTPLGPLPDGRRVVISMAADVTDRKLAEARIEHLNRVLRAIRDINQLITREQDRDALIQEACRLLAENRSYSAAFIALTGANHEPILWASTGGAKFTALSDGFSEGQLPPCCAAAREVDGPLLIIDRNSICRTCAVYNQCGDTHTLCIELRHGAAAHGYLAVTLGHDLGIDLEEQELFSEMAGDLAFALNTMSERSARIQAERDREELHQQLLQSQKMEAIGQLAGGVAHDFNNILQAIMGHAQLLLDEVNGNSDQRAGLDEILNGSQRAADLTRQLLAFSRRQIMRPAVLDLNELTGRFLSMIRRLIGEHIHLEWLPGNHLGSVHADSGMIEQVLMNLCVNARDAMPNGGTLTLETQNVRVDSEYCASHLWARPGRYALISVTDTGCGIDDQNIQHIFEPFFTTKAEGKGTGLGLATVYGIVNQHDGMIQCYSEIGKGSTFKIYLPICERRADSVGPLIEGPAKGGRETILLAEDDDMVRALAKTVLERSGYTVLTARNGEEAVEVFKAHQQKIDLLLFDVVMPRLGGHDALDLIHAIQPGVPVLFSSGYSENAVHTNFVLDEGLCLIQKPYAPTDLLRAIRRILEAR